MNVSTMRKLDRWVGWPVCLLLTGLRKAGDAWRRLRRPAPQANRRMLFVKLAEQGATVLARGAFERAAGMVGRENLYFLVFEENRFILDVMEAIPAANVIAIPTGGAWRMAKGLLAAVRRVRRAGIDAAVDLEFFARGSAILTYLSRAAVRVGLHSFGGEGPWRGDLMTHRISYNPHMHTAEMFDAMVAAAALPPGALPAMDIEVPPAGRTEASFTPGREEIERVRAMVRERAGGEEFSPLVLLNANASDLLPLRRWPEERYVELARRLVEADEAVRVAFTGSPAEAGHGRRLAEAVGSPRCFSLAGATTLRELLVLYCLAEVLVTNDSGPAHFAALTPIRSVVLFGPETPALFAARTPRSRAIWKGIPCSPCVSAYNNRTSACRDNVCMKRITVEEVFREVAGALRGDD